MKTIDDLRLLIPIIVAQIATRNHEIGESYPERDEDGWGITSEYHPNSFKYEDDGWLIEIEYECCGEWAEDAGDYWNPPYRELIRAWGEVTDISVYHYDEDTGEESDFSDDDLDELWGAINAVLEDVA